MQVLVVVFVVVVVVVFVVGAEANVATWDIAVTEWKQS